MNSAGQNDGSMTDGNMDTQGTVQENVQPPGDSINHTEENVNAGCEQYKQQFLRALADYRNLEKRMTEQRQEIRTQTQAGILAQLLPFLDNLEKAEVFMSDPGLKMIKDQFVRTLRDMDLEEIPLLDTEFDPTTAEAIEVVPGEKNNIIVSVITKGYRSKGRVIRPGQVKVSKVE